MFSHYSSGPHLHIPGRKMKEEWKAKKCFSFRMALPCRLGTAASPRTSTCISVSQTKNVLWTPLNERWPGRKMVEGDWSADQQRQPRSWCTWRQKRGLQPLGSLCLHQRRWRMVKGKAGETENSSSVDPGALPDGSEFIVMGQRQMGEAYWSLLMSPSGGGTPHGITSAFL